MTLPDGPVDDQPTTRLTFNDSNHSYYLRRPNGRRTRIPSVSTLVRLLHPFDNDRWKVGRAMEGAAAQFDDIAALVPGLRRDRMVELGLERLAEGRDFGTSVHHYAEQLWTGETVDVPEQYAGHVHGIADWFDQSGASVVAAEQLVWADEDEWTGGCAVAGRFDLIVDHPTLGRTLVDLKTYAAESKGDPRPAQWALQLAAYAAMEFAVLDDIDIPMHRVDNLAVLHVGADGAQLYVADLESQHRAHDQWETLRALKNLPKPTMEGTPA